MPVAVESAEEPLCSPQQMELLSGFCSSGLWKGQLPTYSIKWQLSSSFTSFDRLAYTWQAVASHHPVLRTSITLSDNFFDLKIRNRASRIQIKSANTDLARKTELETAELSVFVGDTFASLCLRVHYALVDRPSLARIRHDFDLFYDGLACEPHTPFKYYVNHIHHRDHQKALLFWRQTMSGAVTPLTYGIPTELQGKERSYCRFVDPQLLEGVSRFCETYNVSFRHFFHATWALIQYRHTATTDGTVVFSVSGRDTTVPECKTYVGLTEQLYPMKIQIESQFSALDWVMQVSKVDQDSASNAFIGYERIAREILPLEVQVHLSLSDGGEIVEEGFDKPRFPLVLNFDHNNGSITATYRSGMDKNENLVFLVGHLITAMEAVVAESRTPIGLIRIISKDEQALLVAHSEPLTQPVPGLVHRLVEREAETQPDKEAINYEGQSSLTYAELNRLSNQVARQLKTKRGDNVPVCMDRSPYLIIALLAILKTGAAYVVLDPESPNDRHNYIVSDVQAPLVLTDDLSKNKFADSFSIEHLVESASQFEDTNLYSRQEPSDIVYIIYTSGSTGKPKGVILEHQAAFTGLDAFPELLDLRQLLFHNPVFSAAQRSIWSTLKQGGCLCLARKENLTTRISDMINVMRVNVIDVTPSTASLIDPESVPSLRRLTVAGELINPALLPIWMDRVELLNAYGLSEVTQINWRHGMLPERNPQNIGRPVDSTRSYVLIPGTTQQASVLEPGELCLGGHQLARSYLNRPKKTEESFLPNPFGPGRIYRTGDMVVTHPDGSIEMIGRIDFQVKINGQRVEPGEINYYLQKHAGVFDSCTVSATVVGKKSLVAVVVPKHHQSWPSLARELQQLLRQQLPSYLVPPYWLSVPELPLNINGKVDVPRVAQLAESTPRKDMLIHYLSRRRGSIQSPLTSVEESMRAAWSEALNIPAAEMSLDDSFLDLGGSSLEAIMVTSSARARLIDVKLQDIMLQKSLRDVVNVSREMASPLEQNTIQPFSLLPKSSQLDRSSLDDAWPVTPSQEPLIADLVLGGTQYVYSKILRPKKWSIQTFKAAFATLIERNAFLRSTFVEHGSTYLQLVRKQADLPWKTSSKSLKEYIESGESQSLVLGQPFCRLIQTKSGEVVVTFHHALFDYWSSQFFYDDIAAVINQKPFPERPFYNQYAHYISEQDVSKSRNFWKNYLQGAQATLLGDPKRRRPELVVSDIGVDLHALSKDLGIPVGSLLYAAWAIVLSFETTLTDLTFAATFSGRDIPIPDILRMYGPTVTSAPIRIHIEDKLTLSEVGKAIQTEVIKVSEHAYCSLRTILWASGQNSMLFNTAVNFLLRPTSDAESEIDFLDTQSPLVSDHIKLEMDSKYTGKLSLTSSLGNAISHSVLDEITTVFKCFARQAETLVGDVFSKLRAIDLPLDDSRKLDFSQFPLAHSLFEQRATTHSFKVAVTNEHGEELTYQRLNEKANQLAAFLRGKGVRPETVIPLYLDKSISTLISMLGIWKAGGAFCALDPTNPTERNTLILRELKATMVITDKTNVSGLTSSGVEAVVLDELSLDSLDSENFPLRELEGQNLAYVLYTSGSTGKPKGVMITHGSVAAATQGMIKAASVTDEWRSLWALNYAFDGSYFDVFPLLGTGGTLCVVRQQVVFSDIAGYINRLKVTHLNVTPTIARTFTPDDVPDLKVLIVGGEPLHPGILDTWANRITVYNNYGPTEGTVMVTTTTVTQNSSLSYIGAALPSAELSVRALDSEASLPRGETGELCISGPHVSRGYLNRSEANKAAFFTNSNGRRVYRTGDLARLLPDGGFELLGRKDDQVKVNGYRIELGEIETAIQNTNSVEGCVVLAPNIHQKKQLVACCKLFSTHREVPEANCSLILDPSALDSLRDLPSKLVSLAYYMMPAVWLPLAEFPLLPSGKIDRKSLLRLVEAMDSNLLTKFQGAMSTVSLTSEHVDAQSNEEEVLQVAWGAVFDKEPSQISTLAAFHALGGDSITAINLVSVCRRRGYELAVADVMAYPTIQMQAKRLSTLQVTSDILSLADAKYGFEDQLYTELSAGGIEREAVEAIYPCLPGQAEFLTQGRTEHQFWQLMTVRKVPLNFDLPRWTEFVTALTARNQILRTIFLNVQSIEDPEWVQVVLRDPILDLDTISYQNDEEKQMIIDSLWESSFPSNKPAVQYRILTPSVNGSLELYIKLDHGMYDGTLLRIFDEQFTAMAKGLPPPPHIEFNRVIHHYVNSPAKKMLNFWTSLLAGARFQWPSNLSAPKVNRVLLHKTGLETNSAARRIGVTPPIIFQTAWSLLLGVLGRTTDVVHDNLLTGRNLPLDDPQAINGNCANFLPFRSQFPAETRLPALLHDTQSIFWETTNNGLVGLADIYKALAMPRTEAAAKTMFCFQPFDPPPPPPQGVENDMARHMRWIVMSMSSNRMFFNYAFMCEVFKAPDGYKVKFQYDGRALSEDEAGWAASKYSEILAFLNRCGEEDTVAVLWKAIGVEKMYTEFGER